MAIMTIGNFYIIFAGCIASLIVLWTKPLHINHTAKGHTSLARQSLSLLADTQDRWSDNHLRLFCRSLFSA